MSNVNVTQQNLVNGKSLSYCFQGICQNNFLETSKWRSTNASLSAKMGCCLRKQVSKPPELFRHTSLIDEENNFYIDHNERLHTLLELDEVMYCQYFQSLDLCLY